MDSMTTAVPSAYGQAPHIAAVVRENKYGYLFWRPAHRVLGLFLGPAWRLSISALPVRRAESSKWIGSATM